MSKVRWEYNDIGLGQERFMLICFKLHVADQYTKVNLQPQPCRIILVHSIRDHTTTEVFYGQIKYVTSG